VVDWGLLSTPDPKENLYSGFAYPIIVTRNIPIVFQRVADFIRFMVEYKYTTLSDIHIIGHSLGAHISGGVGRTVASFPENKGRKIARVTGLDAAGPLFEIFPGVRVQEKITKKDADFVDLYHTAAGTLGTKVFTDGHANFLRTKRANFFLFANG